MKKVDMLKAESMTGDYTGWLYSRLEDKEAACRHIQAALQVYEEDGDSEAFLLAIRDVTKANGGVGWLSDKTSLNREHLYRLLSGKGNPRLETLSLILKALGMHMTIAVSHPPKRVGN